MSSSPSSAPSTGALLIFDGDCRFCSTAVERLHSALPRFPDARPYQWIELDDYALTREDVERYTWYVTPRRQFAGHLAFSALLRAQPGAGHRFLGWLLAIPPWSWAAAAGYHVIAANRHRLPGGTPACAMPRPR